MILASEAVEVISEKKNAFPNFLPNCFSSFEEGRMWKAKCKGDICVHGGSVSL